MYAIMCDEKDKRKYFHFIYIRKTSKLLLKLSSWKQVQDKFENNRLFKVYMYFEKSRLLLFLISCVWALLRDHVSIPSQIRPSNSLKSWHKHIFLVQDCELRFHKAENISIIIKLRKIRLNVSLKHLLNYFIFLKTYSNIATFKGAYLKNIIHVCFN